VIVEARYGFHLARTINDNNRRAAAAVLRACRIGPETRFQNYAPCFKKGGSGKGVPLLLYLLRPQWHLDRAPAELWDLPVAWQSPVLRLSLIRLCLFGDAGFVSTGASGSRATSLRNFSLS
jgi:hypothetical protein